MALAEILNQATLDPNVGELALVAYSITARICVQSYKEVVIAPPALYLIPLKEILRGDIKVSAQNCYFQDKGAFTGEIRLVHCTSMTLIFFIQSSIPIVHLNSSMQRSPTFSLVRFF